MCEGHHTTEAAKTCTRKVSRQYLDTVERIHDTMLHNPSNSTGRHMHGHRSGRQTLVFVLAHYYDTTAHSTASKRGLIATMSPSPLFSLLPYPFLSLLPLQSDPSSLFLRCLLFCVLGRHVAMP